MKEFFINAALTKAINDYQSSKEQPDGILYNSFLTVVIRLLVCLYSELDIINPLMTDNEEALKSNLTKFGYKKESLEAFFNDLEAFYVIDRKNEEQSIKEDNPYFVVVQKELIDMLIAKKLNFHLTEKEVKEFFQLLYKPSSSNPLQVSYNYLTAKDVYEVENYFKREMQDNVKSIEVREKRLLPYRAYELLNYKISDIEQMSSEAIDKINHSVYDFFKIRENAINKEYLLEKSIEEYERSKNKVTTGNGYVDILLIMGVICTAVMLITVVTLLVF